MPRHAKGPRLWLRPARPDGTAAAWFVLDGTRQRGTGLGSGASPREKEDALKAYLAEKHTADVSVGSREQNILNRSGDNLRIDWGYFHLALPVGEDSTSAIAPMTGNAAASNGPTPLTAEMKRSNALMGMRPSSSPAAPWAA